MSDVRRLLPKTRLLTLTGAGGVGKTRLARRVAPSVRGWFPDGVEFVELATLEDGELLEPAVAASLGLSDTRWHAMPGLTAYLMDKRLLLVLDNCEHLLQECADLVDGLLRAAPRLRILATSRQALGVSGEQVLKVPSLPVPDLADTVRGIARCDAVRLFVERAVNVRPGFVIDAANALTIAHVAQRLDGIPLAIELAAGRLRVVPVEQLVRELDERFQVPANGDRALLPRHQTLRATMDWSFALCSPDERQLWARLSMFPAGVDLETIEAVCGGDGIDRDDVYELVAGLADKSVLTVEHREPEVHYRMLETLRAYGREHMAAAEEQALSRRYRDHYRRLADRNGIDRMVPDQFQRFRTLQRELPNIRAALDLCFARPCDGPMGLEIASSLWGYWVVSGALNEGRHWLDRGLALVPEASTARMAALAADCEIAVHQGNLDAATPRLNEYRTLARQIGNESVIALGVQIEGEVALVSGQYRRGLALMDEALARHRAIGDVNAVSRTLFQAAAFSSPEDPDRAKVYGEQLLALCETYGAPLYRPYALLVIGISTWRQGDWRRAEALMREALMPLRIVNDQWCLTHCVEVLAWTAGARGLHERAARLLGAADTLWQGIDSSPTELRYTMSSHQRCDEHARQALPAQAYTRAFRSGTKLKLDRAVAYALQDQEH
ncbi:NB-ARC domain-containing protein [Planotetraspora sp. A-T 1434]|uniref:ATP-binding protein n=1 Tax=Planotetraspora sp. A-T 1434 TaxID=2979219 RepID=UPI0021BFB182|nr:NB-ARC domain-containing protein [Planotetraspora sp. A-T 1434]MCT9931443.1 NB-ARC domain-containing protein [Planotetraspora sp. A-T 1434]